jgi:hypothetical protein
MKYIIEKNNTKSSAYAYVTEELKTLKENISFIKSDIVIDDELKEQLATEELNRIFKENNCYKNFTIDSGGLHFDVSGHYITWSKEELDYRFQNVFDSIFEQFETK